MSGNENKDQPKELLELIDLVGCFIKYFGFKRVHGQIWAHLYFSHEPLDAPSLIKKMDISKALVSMSINDLLKYNVILQQEGKSNKGTLTYTINPELVSVITEVLRTRESVLLNEMHSKWTEVSSSLEQSGCTINRARVEQFGCLVNQAQRHLNAMIGLASIDMSSWKKFSSLR